MQMKKPINAQFTPEGFENLKKEFQELTEKRPGVVVRMSAAREMGDLSENAGYHAAKEELGNIDRRLRELKLLMRFGEILESQNTGVVDFGTVVTIDDGQNASRYTIVGALEADPLKGKISDTSPIGRALLGKRAGETVQIEVPNGKTTFKIIEISQ